MPAAGVGYCLCHLKSLTGGEQLEAEKVGVGITAAPTAPCLETFPTPPLHTLSKGAQSKLEPSLGSRTMFGARPTHP